MILWCSCLCDGRPSPSSLYDAAFPFSIGPTPEKRGIDKSSELPFEGRSAFLAPDRDWGKNIDRNGERVLVEPDFFLAGSKGLGKRKLRGIGEVDSRISRKVWPGVGPSWRDAKDASHGEYSFSLLIAREVEKLESPITSDV